jgi:hypothetical protein
MAEANRSILQIPTIHITTAAHCLAAMRARNAVKDQPRKQGLGVSHYAARDNPDLGSDIVGGWGLRDRGRALVRRERPRSYDVMTSRE